MFYRGHSLSVLDKASKQAVPTVLIIIGDNYVKKSKWKHSVERKF